ncbi:MAG TPA: hypothetical protein VKH81_25330 [Candidatus Angelobacter sp.]|nr:hypothetical protein [Candidatus Angelobacter sp.]
MGRVLGLVFALLIAGISLSAADGTFRGRVIEPPDNTPSLPGWIYVQGRNRMLRRVEVAHAVVVFGEGVPSSQRHKCNSECLSAGQDVRVTARQDSAGEWRAKRVEILHLATHVAGANERTASLRNLIPELSLKRITNSADTASQRLQDKSADTCMSERYNGRVLERVPFLAGVCYEI